jgi:uncharacterized protein YyaL (SSP411 family)
MLYDNGPLLGLYADLARVAPDPRFERAAVGIVDWLAGEMRAPDGAFRSSLDADSEGEEGRFYVWERDEVRGLLDADEYAVAARHFGLDAPPNFERRAWHLHVAVPIDGVAAELGVPAPVAAQRLAAAKQKLLAARAKRVRPGLDDKILTSWNALAIGGLARAARRLAKAEWADLAFAAADALRRHAWRGGRLFATRKGDRAHLNAYLDDHAFLLAALDELMQTRFRLEDYAWARAIAERLLEGFEDRRDGGFFFTSHDHEALIHRGKPGHDGATPSGNGVAASALIALGHLAGEPRYVEAAERAVLLFAPQLAATTRGFSSLIAALDALVEPPATVLLAGDPRITADWHRELAARPMPSVHVYDVGGLGLPPELRKGPPPDPSTAVGWVCRGTVCLPPIETLGGIERALLRARS